MTAGTHNWHDPDELWRAQIIASHMTVPEMVKFFRGWGAQDFARVMGIPVRDHRWQQCVQIKSHFASGEIMCGKATDETDPPLIVQPEPPLPPLGGGDNKTPFCDCPNGQGLRWEKHDNGEAITWDIILTEEFAFMYSEILACVMFSNRAWENVCGIKFQQNTQRGEVEADINWNMGPLEDGVLGAAWMPRVGTSMDMNGRHPLCGDITYNSTFPGWDRTMRKGVGVHELGHATGQEHIQVESDSIMQPYYDEQIILPSPRDGARALVKYPERITG